MNGNNTSIAINCVRQEEWDVHQNEARTAKLVASVRTREAKRCPEQ